MSRTKDSLVNELSRLDVSCFRKNGLIETGKYKHEPPKFRIRLNEVYNKLAKEDIQKLINIRNK
tara:strand:+ start:484 stop:675 length:192 start_codon:yes stop_codon:yes gene_type:complete